MKISLPLIVRMLILAGLIFAAVFAWQSPAATAGNGSIALQAPPFVGVAYAQEAAPQGIAAIQDEAGIAAYFDKGQPITLSSVRGLYRTIEVETDTYILGSMEASGQGLTSYKESEDPHVYVNTNGWVMAYYLNTDPVSKIVDVYNYGGGAINTKLEMVLNRVAPGYTPTFYDFRYPNATKLLLVAEQAAAGDNSFTINLPSAFPNYFERSWVLGDGSWYETFSLNGTVIGEIGDPTVNNLVYGALTPAQLGVDQTHTVLISNQAVGALAIVYRDVP